jgi:hypothetical protein
MSDTPETDNLARGNHVVPTEFAQDLERERDKARDWVFRLRKHRAIARNFGEQMERERDALREQLNAKPHECHFEKMVDIRWLHFNRRDPQLQRQLQCACGKTRWCETRSKWAVVVEDTV